MVARESGTVGHYRWQRLACDVVEIAYHPPTSPNPPILRDVVASVADVPTAIAALVNGRRAKVTGWWTTSTTGEST